MSTANAPVLLGPALWPAQAHVPSVLGRQLVIERGEGSYVVTTDGHRLFDGTAGLWHAGRAVVDAIECVLEEGSVITPDLGGTASTSDVGKATAEMI